MIVVVASNNLALQLAFNLQLQPTGFLSNNSYESLLWLFQALSVFWGLLMFNSMYFNCLIGSIDLISSKYSVLKETAVLRFDNRMRWMGVCHTQKPDLSKQ